MSGLRLLTAAAIAAAAPFAATAGDGVARADVPGPGQSCTVLHATAQDADGRTMWCNPTMTGAHLLVWQYGGPS